MDEVGIVEDYGFVPRVRGRGEEKRELEKIRRCELNAGSRKPSTLG